MPDENDFMKEDTQYIEMPSGRLFYINDPKFYLPDIAYTLAHQPRWNATSSKFMSVAEHSVRVSYLIQEEGGAPFEGLTHDITEAFLGDVPGPYKSLLPDFVALEKQLWAAFVDRLQEDFMVFAPELDRTGHSKECKRADWRSLFIEARECMSSQGRGWVGYEEYKPDETDMPCYFWDPEEAELRFLNRWDELTP